VVLLKAIAGVTQLGSLKMRVKVRPRRTERSVYVIDQTAIISTSCSTADYSQRCCLLRTGT
jgi:hypothetical protein